MNKGVRLQATSFLWHPNKMGLTDGHTSSHNGNNPNAMPSLPAARLATLTTPVTISSSVPCFSGGVLFASQLAAQTARLLTELAMPFNYRKHRVLMASTGQPELMGDFWLPALNTFLCVYADMPLVEQGRIHTEVAKLGHNVVVLVGEMASPVRQSNSDPKNGWRGWRLEAFSGDMTPGWTTFLDLAEKGDDVSGKSNKICLANMTNPYDDRACTPRLLDLYASVIAPASRHDGKAGNREADTDTPDTTTPLNKTLGKAA